jgi:hypothetical protein
MSNTSAASGGSTLWKDFGTSDIPTYGSMTPSFVQQHGSLESARDELDRWQLKISWTVYVEPSAHSDNARQSNRVVPEGSSEQGMSRFSSTVSCSISDELTMSCADEDGRRGRAKIGPNSTRRTRRRRRCTGDRRRSHDSVEARQEAGHDPELTNM